MNRRKGSSNDLDALSTPVDRDRCSFAHAGIRKFSVNSLALDVFTWNCTTLSKGYPLSCVSTTSAPSCVHRNVEGIYKFTQTPRESRKYVLMR